MLDAAVGTSSPFRLRAWYVRERGYIDRAEIAPTGALRPGSNTGNPGEPQFTAIALIPGRLSLCHHAPAAALTGRLDPTPDVAAVGAWKEARWGDEIQEAWADRVAVKRSNGGSRCAAFSGSRCDREAPMRGGVGSQSMAQATNRRTRVPKGNPRTVRSREPQGSRGGPRGSPGAVTGPAVVE